MAISKIDPAGLDLTGDAAFDTDTLVVDATNNRVGIGTSSPSTNLDFGATSNNSWIVTTRKNGNSVNAIGVNSDYGMRFGAPSDIASGNALISFGSISASDGSTFSEKMRITSSGNVGIGTSSPQRELHIHSNAVSGCQIRLENTDGYAEINADDGGLGFNIGATERMRIDSVGNVLMGTDDEEMHIATSGNGMVFTDGRLYVASTETGTGSVATFNRISSNGNIVNFRASGSTSVGFIGTQAGDLYIANAIDVGLYFESSGTDHIAPCNASGSKRDNAIDLGASGTRFDDVYATNGTIQTSDRNEKQDIATLTPAEMAVAARLSNQFKTFRWIDSVTEKGDNARTHTGIIAQDVQQAFTDEGLDAGDYALFISTTWWETQTEVPAVEAVEAQDAVYDEDGNLVSEAIGAVEAQEAYTRTDTYGTADEAPEGATERTRLGIRYPELLSFMQAYNDQRMASIEARLDALEAN